MKNIFKTTGILAGILLVGALVFNTVEANTPSKTSVCSSQAIAYNNSVDNFADDATDEGKCGEGKCGTKESKEKKLYFLWILMFPLLGNIKPHSFFTKAKCFATFG